jgi:hypothetical protein
MNEPQYKLCKALVTLSFKLLLTLREESKTSAVLSDMTAVRRTQACLDIFFVDVVLGL